MNTSINGIRVGLNNKLQANSSSRFNQFRAINQRKLGVSDFKPLTPNSLSVPDYPLGQAASAAAIIAAAAFLGLKVLS